LKDPIAPEIQGAAAVVDPPLEADYGGDAKLNRGGLAWALFQGGRDPIVILIIIYVFMPYVAGVMVGDPVKGQEVISRWNQWAGWVVLATAPFIGASIDKLGRRKGFLALVVGLMIPLTAALWWARPDGSGLSVETTMLCVMAGQILFGYSEILHNSLLVRAAGLAGAHRASGLALSLGNFLSVLALGFTFWAFALPGTVDWAWVPAQPLFGLDAAAHEPERVVAWMAAGLLLLGSIPLFLFTPDAPPTGVRPLRAFAQGAAELWGMVRTVSRYRDAAVYIGSRMFFVDGMNGVLVYIGVFAVGVMKWGALEMLAFGILLSIFAVLGGFVGRWLDAGVGPKNALRIEISGAMIGLAVTLGMRPDLIAYLWPVAPGVAVWDSPVFSTLPDLVFAGIGCTYAIFITAQYASSRTLLTRLTPPDQTGTFFGVYALSGVATAWLAPTLVNRGTAITGTQQGGFAMLLLLLGLGLAGLMFVRGGGRSLALQAD
jgi:UMF1 family MFS transporter